MNDRVDRGCGISRHRPHQGIGVAIHLQVFSKGKKAPFWGLPEVPWHSHLHLVVQRLLTGRMSRHGLGDYSRGLPSSVHLASIPGILQDDANMIKGLEVKHCLL